MWAIAIQVEHKEGGGYSGSRQLPLFYLEEKVQGITDASHAARIALEIADPFGAMQSRGEIAHVSAEFMGPEQMALCRVREGDRDCRLDADHSVGGMATMHEDERGPWETAAEAAAWARERDARNAVRRASHEGFTVPVTRPAEGRTVTTMGGPDALAARRARAEAEGDCPRTEMLESRMEAGE